MPAEPAAADGAPRAPVASAAGLAAGLAIIAALAQLDGYWGSEGIITVTVLLGPLVASLVSRPAHVAVVAAAAVAVAVVSGTWNDNFGDGPYLIGLLVVVVGAASAVVAARRRVALQAGRSQFALLAQVADLGEDALAPEETADAVMRALVPAFADLVILDLAEGDALRRVAVRAAGPRAAELEAWLMQRAIAEASVPISSRRAVETAGPTLMADVAAADLGAMARDEDDLRMMQALAATSSMAVPLRARGKLLGSLSLSVTAQSGRRYHAGHLAFGEVLAGRVALALDNARLYAELRRAESQLSTSLGGLADGVVVEDPDGEIVYANAAAATRFGHGSPAALTGAPAAALLAGFELFADDGSPLPAGAVMGGGRSLPGEATEPLTVRHLHHETRAEGWTVVKTTPVVDDHGAQVLAVTVLEDVTELKRAETAQRLLARVGHALTAGPDFDRNLQAAVEVVVPALADGCVVSVPDAQGRVWPLAVAHADPASAAAMREVAERYPPEVSGESIAAKVLRDGESRRANAMQPVQLRGGTSTPEHLERVAQLELYAVLIVPLLAGPEPIGVLAVVTADSRRAFTAHDQELAEQLGRQIGTALQTTRLHEERAEIAATLQAGLFPADLPEMPGWSSAPLYRPAAGEGWVGGDFYDAFPVRDGWFVVMGDVVGRGAPAAALTALARHTLRTAARLLELPLAALGELNHELYARGQGALCTLACALLPRDPGAGPVTVVLAGHPQPVRIRGGVAEQVGRFGPMLGAFPDGTWEPVAVDLEPGDTLVLYTDGVIDTVGTDGRLGEERLRAALADARGPADAIERLERCVTAFEQGHQVDDTAALALARADATAAAEAAR